jgi:hypothetical protein
MSIADGLPVRDQEDSEDCKVIRWGLARRMNLNCGERGQACEGAGRNKDRVRAAETEKKKRGPRS